MSLLGRECRHLVPVHHRTPDEVIATLRAEVAALRAELDRRDAHALEDLRARELGTAVTSLVGGVGDGPPGGGGTSG